MTTYRFIRETTPDDGMFRREIPEYIEVSFDDWEATAQQVTERFISFLRACTFDVSLADLCECDPTEMSDLQRQQDVYIAELADEIETLRRERADLLGE